MRETFTMNAIFNFVKDRAENLSNEVTQICSKLISFNTVNPPGRVRECVEYIEAYFKSLGVGTEVYARDPEKPNLVARIPGKRPSRILYLCHTDVVTEGSLESWTHDPFGGEVSEGKVWGRGATDMKGSCASAMVAAKILLDVDERERAYTEFWFTADEECGSSEGAKWLAETGRFRGDVCIVGDSFDSTPRKPAIDIGCKGSMELKVKVKGRTAHGSTPFYGDNAVDKLLKLLECGRRISDFKLDVPPELESVIESSIRFALDDPDLTEEQKAAIMKQYHYPTVSLNLIRGGKKSNVVPDYAEASLDIRLTPGVDFKAVKKRLESLVSSSGVRDYTLEWHVMEGYYESLSSKAVETLSRAVEEALGVKPTLKLMWGGTDGCYTHVVSGIPSPAFGAGVKGMAHAPDEYVTIENLVMTTKVYALLPLIYGG
ncbi:hypothetical protein DRO28_03810 [Candidatus Bathyarchaeota archaeon]|nr:MAG: hypothetical protein DRO28_03810 [Candidatus Bathyarchaeota archaeon]